MIRGETCHSRSLKREFEKYKCLEEALHIDPGCTRMYAHTVTGTGNQLRLRQLVRVSGYIPFRFAFGRKFGHFEVISKCMLRESDGPCELG